MPFVLTDIDGLESRKISGQLLCRHRRKESDVISSKTRPVESVNPLAVQAGKLRHVTTLPGHWSYIRVSNWKVVNCVGTGSSGKVGVHFCTMYLMFNRGIFCKTSLIHIDASTVSGMTFCRQILLVCGDKIVDVLSVLINGKSACGITSSLAIMFNAKEESRKAQEAICSSLAGLRQVAKLACVLGKHISKPLPIPFPKHSFTG